jgi:hypothetical protein
VTPASTRRSRQSKPSRLGTLQASVAVAQLGVALLAGRRRRHVDEPSSNGDGPDAQRLAVATSAATLSRGSGPPAPQPSAEAPPPVAPLPGTPRAPGPEEARRPIGWTWTAGLMLVAACGLLVVVVANALSREGREWAEPLFWAGLMVMVLPIAIRLAARGPGRGERVLLAGALGMLLYLAKVLHDPFAFTYSDEIVHLRNVENILDSGGLVGDNSILPVTIFYPGLEAISAGLAALTGASLFTSGVVVVGAARLVMMLALFLLFERLSGSARVAGVAALVYVANPNFLFWSGQFSYQSLALPLASLAVLAVAMRTRRGDAASRGAWMIVAMVATTAVVMTHHLTSYALVAVFAAISIAVALGFGGRAETAWGLAVFALAACAVWLVYVAPATDHYLTTIFQQTYEGVRDAITGHGETRQLFESDEGRQAALWERAIGLGSVVLIALALPFGLRRVWQRRRSAPLVIVLGVLAVAYLATLPLRLVPSAWETANRAADFLFVGVSLTVALACVGLWRSGRARWAWRVGLPIFVAVTVVGGVVAGWPPTVRLSQPYRALIGDREVEPQGVSLARWAGATIGPDRRFVAAESDARLLLAHGQLPRLGKNDSATGGLLDDPELTPAQVESIRENQLSFVVVDRREVADDNMAGYFFSPKGAPLLGLDGPIPDELWSKFERPGVDRIFDSGDIVVYDVRQVEP